MVIFTQVRNLILLIFLTLFLTGCSNEYDEKYITSQSTITKAKEVSNKLKALEIANLSYLDSETFVLNNLVINRENNSYGTAPEGGFYVSYYEESLKNHFTNWSEVKDALLPTSSVSKVEVLDLLRKMNKLGLTDLQYRKASNIYLLQWGSSAMNGFDGLILGEKEQLASEFREANFSILKEVQPNTFYFSVR